MNGSDLINIMRPGCVFCIRCYGGKFSSCGFYHSMVASEVVNMASRSLNGPYMRICR